VDHVATAVSDRPASSDDTQPFTAFPAEPSHYASAAAAQSNREWPTVKLRRFDRTTTVPNRPTNVRQWLELMLRDSSVRTERAPLLALSVLAALAVGTLMALLVVR
jgi:hypothetical protein